MNKLEKIVFYTVIIFTLIVICIAFYTLIYCIYNRTYSYSVSRVVTYQSNDASEENENNDEQPEIDRNYGNNDKNNEYIEEDNNNIKDIKNIFSEKSFVVYEPNVSKSEVIENENFVFDNTEKTFYNELQKMKNFTYEDILEIEHENGIENPENYINTRSIIGMMKYSMLCLTKEDIESFEKIARYRISEYTKKQYDNFIGKDIKTFKFYPLVTDSRIYVEYDTVNRKGIVMDFIKNTNGTYYFANFR